MLGRNNGIATKLTNKNPYLFVSHCIAHSNSEKRVETLRKFQSVLDHPTLKIKNIIEIRWLSWYKAIKNIFLSIEPFAHLNDFLLKVPSAKDSFIGNHHILFDSQDKIDLQVDIIEFVAAVICEINDRFSHRSILSAMKIMNSIEWPKNKESLNDYGKKELKELIDSYGVANEPNYPMPIIDADAIYDKWDNFKAIAYNFSKL
ncbi:hypothetical protein C1645_882646 [Glomus cerebriforme]|uniref:Uncharacterized protein n=1 Tax=Glomus cerebriforme TaxID=658196 RepID=A0A397S0P0_9GLOM|nr:hypothetical protein C1645_882646 [Glomus cerebriforme]